MLECAHIFPFALGTFRNNVEQHQVAAIWTTIYRYFLEVRSRLDFHYNNINDIENVMILETILYKLFGKLLGPTDVRNTYEVQFFNRYQTIRHRRMWALLVVDRNHGISSGVDSVKVMTLPFYNGRG